MLPPLVISVILTFFLAVTVHGIDEPKRKHHFDHPDTTNWIDPTVKFPLKKVPNPLDNADHDHGHQQRITETDCAQYFNNAAQKNRSDIIMLRHVLRNFVVLYRKTGNTADDFIVTLRIQRSQLDHFERLLDNPNIMHSAPIIDAWNEVLQSLNVQKEPTSVESVEQRLGIRLNLIYNVLLIFSLPFLIIYLEMKTGCSLLAIVRRIFQYILLVSFIISFPWTWFRLYQEKVAAQQHLLMEKSDAHCQVLSAGQIFARTFKNFFSMAPDASPCEKYYRAVNVNPFLDVPPTMAVVVTITTFIVEPFKHLGKAFGEFFQAVLAPLPFYMYPVMIIVVVFIIFLLIITQSRYEIHLPWLFAKIQPGARATPLRLPSHSRREYLDYESSPSRGKRRLRDDRADYQREREWRDESPEEERFPKYISVKNPSVHGMKYKGRMGMARLGDRSGRNSRTRNLPITGSRSLVDSRAGGDASRSPSFPGSHYNDSSS